MDEIPDLLVNKNISLEFEGLPGIYEFIASDCVDGTIEINRDYRDSDRPLIDFLLSSALEKRGDRCKLQLLEMPIQEFKVELRLRGMEFPPSSEAFYLDVAIEPMDEG